MNAADLAGLLGLTGSVLLAVPAWQGLGDRKTLDNARRIYEINKANALKIEDDTRRVSELEAAWKLYETDVSGAIAQSIGQYPQHRRITLCGFAALFLAFFAMFFVVSEPFSAKEAAVNKHVDFYTK